MDTSNKTSFHSQTTTLVILRLRPNKKRWGCLPDEWQAGAQDKLNYDGFY